MELWPKSQRAKDGSSKVKKSLTKSIDDLADNDNEEDSDTEKSDKEVEDNASEVDKLEEDADDIEEVRFAFL